MSIRLNGYITSGIAELGIRGAHVQVSVALRDNTQVIHNVITGPGGQFSFRFTDDELNGEKPEVASLKILDADGAQIHSVPALVVNDLVNANHMVRLDDSQIHNAGLHHGQEYPPVIPENSLETIRSAIRLVESDRNASTHLSALDSAYARLPLLLNSESIVSAARGVLLGRSSDIAFYEVLLDDLELHSKSIGLRKDYKLSQPYAEAILNSDTAVTGNCDFHTDGQYSRASAVEKASAIQVLAAAMRLGGKHPARTLRNILVVLDHFALADEISVLSDLAQLTLSGNFASRQEFQWQLHNRIRPLSEGFRVPFLPGIPIPDFPDVPPQIPELPFIPRFWGRFGECSVMDLIYGLRDRMLRSHSFEITSIEPAHACPGDVVTIRGSGFLFEGQTGLVLFPGAEQDTYVTSDVPISWSENEIQVRVPTGAYCGRLELDIPGTADSTWICDLQVDLFPAVTSTVRFTGGTTSVLDFNISSSADCVAPGGMIHLDWRICNAEHLELEVKRHDSRPDFGSIETISLDPSTNGTYYRVPDNFEQNISLVFTLTATSTCGQDSEEQRIAVRRAAVDPATDPYSPAQFINFGKNIFKENLRMASPTNLAELVNAIDHAEAVGGRVGIRGGGCSYSDIVAPDPGTPSAHLINTDFITSINSREGNLAETPVLQLAIRRELLLSDTNDTDSMIPAAAMAEYRKFITVSPLRNRLFQVGGGIRLNRMLCTLLDIRDFDNSFTMPTLGGGIRHSLMGAISTGTHGSTTQLPPISDFIRAIHLVGTGGQQWWLEPASMPITDRTFVELAKNQGKIDPCINIVYDDNLFYSALVSFGTVGVINSVVVETINSHKFRGKTVKKSWSEVQTSIRDRILTPPIPLDWHYDITMDSMGNARESTLNFVSSDTPDEKNLSSSWIFKLAFWALQAIPFIAAGIPLFFARQAVRMLNPFNIPSIVRETVEFIAESVEVIGAIILLIGASVSALASGNSRPMEVWVENSAPKVLNWGWRLPFFGPMLINAFQDIFTDIERPQGEFVARDFQALTFDLEWPCVDTSVPNNYSDVTLIERMIQSYEFAVPADQASLFASAIMAIAEEVREGPHALIAIINLRFTQATRAIVGMQQFDRTCMVEIFTIRGLNGNAAFDAKLHPLASSFKAIPHWGMFSSPATNYTELFREKLGIWQRSVQTLDRGLRTFQHGLSVLRSLVS